MKELIEIVNRKYKAYSFLGKLLIFIFLITNIFNLLPLKISDPLWASSISLYIVDTSTIFFLGFWSINASIIEINKIYFLVKNNLFNKEIDTEILEIFKNKFNPKKIISKKNKLNKYINIILLFYLALIIFQFYIYILGLNNIESQVNINFSQLENEVNKKMLENKNLSQDEISIDLNENIISDMDFKSEEVRNLVLESARSAKFELLKQRVKVILLSLIYCLGFKLIIKN